MPNIVDPITAFIFMPSQPSPRNITHVYTARQKEFIALDDIGSSQAKPTPIPKIKPVFILLC